MTASQSAIGPLSTPTPWNDVSSGYLKSVMRNLSQYADEAIAMAHLTPESRILDVACGPGTLSLLAADNVEHVTAIDFSAEMLNHFGDIKRARQIENIEIHEGNGENLPFPDNSFDAAFSMFGLMFFADRKKGFGELYRTLKPGGCAVVSSWAPMAKSPFMKVVFGAISLMAPQAAASPTPVLSQLEDPVLFKKEMESAGFKNVQVKPITKNFPIGSVETLWQECVEGNARLVMIKKETPPTMWNEKEKLALDYLKKTLPQLPTSLTSDAWLAVGKK